MPRDATAKRDQILDAALGVFGRYGYRLTSMDLLAQASSMSRPALYQHFGGKEDIFRTVGTRLVDQMIRTAEKAAEAEGSTADRLFGVLTVKLELSAGTLDANARKELFAESAALGDATGAAGNLSAALRTRLIAVVAAVLDSAAADLDLLDDVLSAQDAAALLVDALTGLAQEPDPPAVLSERLRRLIGLTLRGLSTGAGT
ncbi:TetR/AcrR family transcriptional regulator [Streptomyces sp. NA02950]|uniref:TetR/AcrR family transcriptional regulator n=1 Tax=Streptomyces sp. NA02950 TaxID=2742137 RepID=UPI0015912841|nr:TetR/AcrR family transcriptional regulator [Streptomyces sp. NA02950]QKV95573.1 TetR/AcrR family transcriptional regulator [Streptomyces sp. NA02950]